MLLGALCFIYHILLIPKSIVPKPTHFWEKFSFKVCFYSVIILRVSQATVDQWEKLEKGARLVTLDQ